MRDLILSVVEQQEYSPSVWVEKKTKQEMILATMWYRGDRSTLVGG